MTTDPVVRRAALDYVGTPPNFGVDTNLIRVSELDAFEAGVAWRDGHPVPDDGRDGLGYGDRLGHSRRPAGHPEEGK